MRLPLLLSAAVLLCSFNQSVFSQQNNFIKEYLERWENTQKYLIAVAETMPEDKYGFKPTPEEMSFAEQLMHIGLAIDWHAQNLIGDRKEEALPIGKRLERYKVGNHSKKEMIEIVNNTFNDASNLIKNFDPAHFEDTLTYNVFNRTKRQIFLLLSDHVTHHRAQMLVYMRLNRIVPPEYVKYQ